MRQTIIRQRPDVRFPIAETLWVIVGTVLLLAVGDVVIVAGLALAATAIATAWWMRRNVEHRALRNDVALVPVSRLPAIGREPKPASAHALWRRHSAA